jgi:carbon monoxide dehydrogenase subunit G
MAEIEVNREFAASAAAVWEKLADFGGIGGWMPGVQGCGLDGEGVGAVRSVSLGGMQIKERLESFDTDGRSLSYSITEGPLPVQNYLAVIQVSETGAGACRVDWTASFDLPEGVGEESIAPALAGAYGGALKALQSQLEG